MKSDFGLIGAVYQALSEEGELPVFHYIPQGTVPPYAALDLKEIGQGNGIPAPHFRTRGTLAVRVWSAYEGAAPLSESLAKLASFFEGKRVTLEEGSAHFSVYKRCLMGSKLVLKNHGERGRFSFIFSSQQKGRIMRKPLIFHTYWKAIETASRRWYLLPRLWRGPGQ